MAVRITADRRLPWWRGGILAASALTAVGCSARCPQLEGGGDGRVDARPQVSVGAVPGQGDGVALGQDHRVVGVIEDELPVREDVVELCPSRS